MVCVTWLQSFCSDVAPKLFANVGDEQYMFVFFASKYHKIFRLQEVRDNTFFVIQKVFKLNHQENAELTS